MGYYQTFWKSLVKECMFQCCPFVQCFVIRLNCLLSLSVSAILIILLSGLPKCNELLLWLTRSITRHNNNPTKLTETCNTFMIYRIHDLRSRLVQFLSLRQMQIINIVFAFDSPLTSGSARALSSPFGICRTSWLC